jgi:hypothetical protein
VVGGGLELDDGCCRGERRDAAGEPGRVVALAVAGDEDQGSDGSQLVVGRAFGADEGGGGLLGGQAGQFEDLRVDG